jgi:hypothetical protein
LGEFGEVSKTPLPETSEMKAAKARLESLKAQRDELRELHDPGYTHRRLLKAWKARIATRMADVRDRMARKDYTVRAKKPLDFSKDPEAVRLATEHETLKEQWFSKLAAEHIRNMPAHERVLYEAGQVMDASRNILSSVDLSATLRQGGFIVFGDPAAALKNARETLQALGNERMALALHESLKLRPNYAAYLRSKLFIAPMAASRLSKGEELTMGYWAANIPVVRASNRAFIMYLNLLRANTFDALMEAQRVKGKEPSLQFEKAIANFLNIATGRGNPGQFGGAMNVLSKFLWSPRLVLSRWQLLTGAAFRGAPWEAKKEIAKFYVRFLMGFAALFSMGLLAGAETSLDPDDKDFLKLRFGPIRVDLGTGLIQSLRLTNRLLRRTAEQVGLKEEPWKRPQSAADMLWSYARTKMSPMAGLAVDIPTGTTVVGEEVTVGSGLKRIVLPLSFHDTVQTFEDMGVSRATAFQILELLGVSVQHYGED